MTETAPQPMPHGKPGTDWSSTAGRGRVLLVTGMSGAGRSSALKALEDMGYEAVDNLPLSLLSLLAEQKVAQSPLAVGIDVRTRDFSVDAFLEAIDGLVSQPSVDIKVLFLDCEDDRLTRRYTETRRRHPLAGDRPVIDGIRLERERVWPLRDRADLVIDTTALLPGDLKRVLHGHFALDAHPGLSLFVTSFSYRYGLPRDADLVVDARFLRNPHYVTALRPLTGRDQAIGDYIQDDSDFPAFFDRLCGWLEPLLPRYQQEGKSYLTIAVGCTGGRHRSVYVAERLAAEVKRLGWPVNLQHRDVDRPVALAGDPA